MIDDNENISELKLLESLDLGHRKIYNEELKQKENEDFVGDINLLLSRLNERIDALKNIPKLEIKTFDIESVNSNIDTNNNNNNNIKNNLNSINKPESQINNPYSNFSSKNNANSNSNNLININSGLNISDTPGLPENNNNNNNLKFRIPDSTNENLNNVNNNLNNNKIVSPNLIINLETSSNKENSKDKENINNNIINNDNNKKNLNQSINNKSELNLKISENEIENNNNNEEKNKNKKNTNNNERDNDVIEINENNLDELVSIPEITENVNKPQEDNNNKNNISKEKSPKKDENRESQNGISQNLNNKDNKEEDINQFEIKNSELVVEEIEFFEPNNQKELNNLRNTNNNENNKKNESQEKIERETEKEKQENGVNEINISQENNKKEDKKETEEELYDKEFNKINEELKRQNTLSSNIKENQNNSKNINPEEKERESKSENNNNETKEKENKKNNLKNNIIKKDDDSDDIKSIEILSEKEEEPKEEKKEKKEEIKKEKDINESIKKEKEDKNQEDAIEIVSEKSVEIITEDKEKKEPEETKKQNNKNDNSKNIINNNTLKNIKEEEEDNVSPNSRIKQNTLNKLNTIPKLKESHLEPLKKTLTQKNDILIQIRSTYTRTEKDESLPDISNIEEYQVLTNLNEEEKSLEQIIPEFKEKILKNEKEDIELRKSSLIKKKCIPLKIDEGQEFSQFFGELQESHPELMQMNFNEENFNSKIIRDSEFEENIFNKLPFDEINSPIGIIETFEIFCQRYILTNEEKKNTLNSNFSKWRKILSDGNSLYRVIMFSIFEAYILNKNIPQLKYLIYDIISQDLNIYENQKVDIEICTLIFAEILYLLEQDNNSKAYEILVKSFSLKDGSFDKLLIIYIRHILSIYSANVKEILPEEERNKIANTNIFNSYMIEYNNIEPSFLNLCSIQYLFDIKINLLYLHGELSAPENRGINLVGEEDDSPIINIGFFYSSYHKLYPENFEVTYNFELPLQKSTFRQLTYIMKDTRKCEACKSETEHIVFLDKKYIICKFCLENALTKIFNFRSDSFMNNGFLGIEYYTRPINLQGSYYIDDYEIIELLESNILETLIQKYSGVSCSICHKKEENTIELKCGCEFCKKCLTETLLKKTKGIKVLNEFEKKQLKNVKCACGKQFDLEQGLKFISKNSFDKEEALNRLKKYVNTLCLICTKELRMETRKNEYEDIDESGSYKRVKMKKMNSRGEEGDIYESEHLLCDGCYKRFLGKKIELNDIDEDEEDKPKNDFVDFEKEIISCSICCRKHFFKNTQNEGCCAGGCVIC